MDKSFSSFLKVFTLLFTLLFLGLFPARAQEFQPSHIAAARAAIAATRSAEQFDRILLTLSDQAKALFQRSGPSLVQEIEEVVDQIALELAARRPELDRQLERVWAARFSEEELNAITAFYTAPVGKKFGETMPLVVQDSLRAANIWRDSLSAEMIDKARAELIKRGYEF